MNDATQWKIQLLLAPQAETGAAVSADVPDAWECEVYAVGAAARGDAAPAAAVEIDDKDVLELELQDGTLLLVAGADVQDYLTLVPAAPARGSKAVGTAFGVAASLRSLGMTTPENQSRDGMGAWMLKSLRLFTKGPAAMTALIAAGTAQDAQLGQRRGLHRLSTGAWGTSKIDKMAVSSEPSLLFLHGTVSSCEGSFRGLWGGARNGDSEVDFRDRLARTYGDRVYGFEHRSLTDGPVANALELVQTLPEGARLHLVSHSRGGMIGELLARASRVGDDPITEADIARFVAQAARSGRDGYSKDADRLRELNQELKRRSLRIERFVRVAAPLRGTTLASGRLDRWASVMLNLPRLGLALVPGLQAVDKGYAAVKGFLLAVVRERCDARVLPGLEAMMPDSPLVTLLNAPEVTLQSPVHVIAGDFDGAGLLGRLGDGASEAFYGGQTDLVVNTPSMSGGSARTPGLFVKPVAGPSVHHLSYFRRRESADALWDALQGSDKVYKALAGPSTQAIARGGVHTKVRPDAPIVMILPGIMGTQLKRDGLIWMNPLAMIAGRMRDLAAGADGVSTDGWIDGYFEAFARHLQSTHEVRPFVYDWRLSIGAAATLFGARLDDALIEAERRKKALRIVAHSMGGLVARLALAQGKRWERLKKLDGSRLVQFGTPNGGSHAMAVVLTGRDSFVQKIERWLDWKHNMREFLDIVRHYQGVLQLLPYPVLDGKTADGADYFAPATWEKLADKSDTNWIAPDAKELRTAREMAEQIMAARLEPTHTCYVAGAAPTPIGLRRDGQDIQIAWTDRGDGRVPWSTGIPANVKAWYVDATHGDLLKEEALFDEYLRLLNTGDCRLPSRPPASRSSNEPVYRRAAIGAVTLYPTAEEVLAEAMAARPPGARRRRAETSDQPARVEIYHGSLAAADTPVLIGAYAYDSLRGSAGFLDKHLGGLLTQAQKMGRYPAFVGEAAVFERTAPDSGATGAIVVGLGAVGEVQPGELTRALAQGLSEFALVRCAGLPPDGSKVTPLSVSALLVGTGVAGVTIEAGMRCLFEAVRRCNRACSDAGMGVRIARLQIFEDEESRSIAAASTARELVSESRFSAWIAFDGRLRQAQGGYRARGADSSGSESWHRVYITVKDDKGLRFTSVTGRAGNRVDDDRSQHHAVDAMLQASTNSTADQPGLSRALYELLLPNGLKETFSDQGGLILAVDTAAAAYPWELLRDEPQEKGDGRPLATRVRMVRQLASPHARRRVQTVVNNNALIIGDTDSGFSELPGAAAEAQGVGKLLALAGHEVTHLQRPDASTVFRELFDRPHRILHLAAHGVVASNGEGETGVVLGKGSYLTAAQVAKLRHVPELVFLNCCHLGNMAEDDRPRWGELAAGLATQLIEMGCRVVIAAGWAVDDEAAKAFAEAFYRAMLEGKRFGEAVRIAREKAYLAGQVRNTWGAYQAYGDETYRLTVPEFEVPQVPAYLHVGQILGDLDLLSARIGPCTKQEAGMYRSQLDAIEKGLEARFLRLPEVREALAQAWGQLNDDERLMAHYLAAMEHAGDLTLLRSIEALANAEIRQGARLVSKPEAASQRRGNALMNRGVARVKALLAMHPTPERLSLLGSYWKRVSQMQMPDGRATERTSITKCVADMCRWYAKASDLSLRQDGDRDYYPTHNLLDGTLVLVACGKMAIAPSLAADFEAARASAFDNACRRLADHRDYFHAHAQVEAERIDAMWTLLRRGPGKGGLDDPSVRRSIASRDRDVRVRMGNAKSHDSSATQLNWLLAVLPTGNVETGNGLRQAVEQLKAELAVR